MENKITYSREYYFNPYLFSLKANVVAVSVKDSHLLLQFDKTICHPQGGGQPADEAELVANDKVYPIVQLICDKDSDVIWHMVSASTEEIGVGAEIEMRINPEKRKLYARLHSAGHLIDVAIADNNFPLTPVKGFHFPEGAYVEYSGQNSTDFKELIEKSCNDLIQKCDDNFYVQSGLYSYEEACKKFNYVPDYIAKDKPTRFLRLVESDPGKPCGGTHVQHIKEIGKLIISKIVKKGKNLRISYSLLN